MKYLSVSSLIFLVTAIEALPHGRDNHYNTSALNWGPCDLPGLGQNGTGVSSDCATLAVPLDYTDPSSAETLSLQLIRARATKEPFRGSILMNPGGPGVSGVETVDLTGEALVGLFGGQYDVIGFDPRGTGRTIPFACSLNWTDALNAPDMKSRSEVFAQDLVEVLNDGDWRDMGYVAEKCYQEQNRTGRFLGTPFVARDMLQIVDALGEDGMLRYFGISYGTLLGQYFASMFPERIDRMLLDSVVDAPDYAAGLWLTALEDTEAALTEFFTTCVAAGPDRCILADFNGPNTTSADLLSSLNSALKTILADPDINGSLAPLLSDPEFQTALRNVVFNPSPETALFEVVKAFIFLNLYSPAGFPALAQTLEPVLRQNFSAILSSFPFDELMQPESYNLGTEALYGIGCSDGVFRAESREEMAEIAEEQQAVSSMSDGFITRTWPCARWRMDAAERLNFDGEFGAKTNFPILFTNGHFDPVTPFRSAENAQKAFEGSVLLTHGGQGHAFANHPSNCTNEAVRAYFINGTLPEEGTVCKPNVPAFDPSLTSLLTPDGQIRSTR